MKQSIILSEKNIVKDAVRFSQKSDIPTAMSKAVALEILRKRMMSGEVVKFLYRFIATQQNGSRIEANMIGSYSLI